MAKKIALTLVLVALLIVSALAVVFSSHFTRQQFITLSRLEDKRDMLDREWSQLLLEESVWGARDRVEKIAKLKLGMKMPSPQEIRVIR